MGRTSSLVLYILSELSPPSPSPPPSPTPSHQIGLKNLLMVEWRCTYPGGLPAGLGSGSVPSSVGYFYDCLVWTNDWTHHHTVTLPTCTRKTTHASCGHHIRKFVCLCIKCIKMWSFDATCKGHCGFISTAYLIWMTLPSEYPWAFVWEYHCVETISVNNVELKCLNLPHMA